MPHGISGLSEKVEQLGLKFGLWVELEMVNKDSDLYFAPQTWTSDDTDANERTKIQYGTSKEYRELIQVDGNFYRLLSPFEGNETAWMAVSQDRKSMDFGSLLFVIKQVEE